MYENSTRSTGRSVSLWNCLLAVGFLALAIGVAAAYRAPATGSELSIYAATPVEYWAGFGAAGLLSLLVAFARPPRVAERLALLLGGLSAVSFVGLPLIRGYHFYGAGDQLTHLGWMRMFAEGSLSPLELLYPGLHSVSLFIASTFGVPDTHAMQLAVVVYMGVYFLFVPLCVSAISDRPGALAIGSFAGFMLLSVNNVGVFMMAYPTTQAFAVVPVVLYLSLRFLARPSDEAGSGYLTAEGVLLAGATSALVLVHPQQALNVAAMFTAIALIQFIARRWDEDSWVAGHRSFLGQALVALAAFGLWSANHERVGVVAEAFSESLLSGADPGDEIAQRAGSLEAIGGGVVDAFARMFVAPTLFCLLTAILVLVVLRARSDERSLDLTAAVRYLAFGTVPVVVAFVLFYAASLTLQPFRYLGFMLIVVTILGAVALSDLVLPKLGWPSPSVRAVAGAVLAVLVAVQLAAVHPSPLIYKSSAGVTEAEMVGYENAFEQRHPEGSFTGVRTGPNRYVDAVYGPYSEEATTFPGKRVAVPPAVWGTNLTEFYPDDRYLPVTRSTERREADLWGGLRYSEEGFRQLETNASVQRVQANGEFTLYYVPAE